MAHGIPHTRDCYPAFPPTLSRQDATIQEQELPIRTKARVWWEENYGSKKDSDNEENKENIPPSNDKEESSQHHNKKEEGHDATVVLQHRHRCPNQ